MPLFSYKNFPQKIFPQKIFPQKIFPQKIFPQKIFAKATHPLLTWFYRHGRSLPWRYVAFSNNQATKEQAIKPFFSSSSISSSSNKTMSLANIPYAIWVSEVMLQQTQVKTVIPYYHRWMVQLPTLKHLANASIEDVLKLWEGLGYYSRARNLHKGAIFVMKHYGGDVPSTFKELLALSGVGLYTAGAIVSFAFNAPYPAIDSNVERVLARLFAIKENVKDATIKKKMWQLIKNHLSSFNFSRTKAACVKTNHYYGDFNQALIELGALVCLPTKPKCPKCCVRTFCLAHQKNIVDTLPVSVKPSKRIKRFAITFVVAVPNEKEETNFYYLAKRRHKLLHDLWEFPTYNLVDDEMIGTNVKSITKWKSVLKHKKISTSLQSKLSPPLLDAVKNAIEENNGQKNDTHSLFNLSPLEWIKYSYTKYDVKALVCYAVLSASDNNKKQVKEIFSLQEEAYRPLYSQVDVVALHHTKSVKQAASLNFSQPTTAATSKILATIYKFTQINKQDSSWQKN